jgi:predicted ArsR family transcriptional regulator
MKSLHENQRRILGLLLDNAEGLTLDALVAELGITRTAVKEHILKLQRLGMIGFVDARGSVGRPKRHYVLSEEGRESFPRQYSWLSTVLLETVAADLGEEASARLMKNLADRVAGSMQERFAKAGSDAQLLGEITATLNELGYRATLREADAKKPAVLEASNCVYHSVALKHPELCAFDTRFLEKASGMAVTLESCIAKGGSVCRFCLKK